MTTLHRTLQIELIGAATADDNTPLPAVIATSAPVSREGFAVAEILDCSASGVDLSRAPLPLIVGHDTRRLAVGVVTDLQPTGNAVRGLIRFGTSAEAQSLRADVLAGIHRSLSVGYTHSDEGTRTEAGTVYRWRPHEVSLVSVPADPAAGFFRSQQQTQIAMNTLDNAPTLTRAEIDTEIEELCRRYALPAAFARGLQAAGATSEGARAAVLSELVARSNATPHHMNPTAHLMPPDTSRLPLGCSTANHSERALIVDTLAARMGARIDGPVLGNLDTVGLAQRALELGGEHVSASWSRSKVIERAMGAHTVSDFPQLLGAAANRVLADAFAIAPAALKSVARAVNVRDFRERLAIRLAGTHLLPVGEHGEYKSGTLDEAAAGWKLQTFGRILAITRHALINDDLDGFGAVLHQFGLAAAQREADELTAALLNPPQIDGKAIFPPGITKALSAEGLAAAVLALRQQKDAAGRLLAQEPATLIVPAALELTARQLVASINATEAQHVQPFALSVAVEPRLDQASATAWYLVASGQGALQYGYLEGHAGPQITTREGFEIDGLEMKCSLDFGAGWVSPYGWIKSTGTA